MKHICNAISNGIEFGIAVDNSIDNPGMFRLVDETDGNQLPAADMFETEEEAIEAIYTMYPDNDL